MLRIIKRCIALWMLLLATANFARAQQLTDSVITLQQCIDIGIKNNLLIKQSEAQAEANRVNWQQARENLLPSINGSINHSISEGRTINPFTNSYINQPITSANYGLNGNLILSSGLTLQNSIKQTRLAYEAGQMDLEQAKNNLTLNLIIGYLQVLSAEDQLKQANTQALVSQKQVERTEVLNKDGAVAPSSFYDLQGQLAGDQLSAVNARNTLELAKLNVMQLMNVTYRSNIRFERQASSGTLAYGQTSEQVYNTAMDNFALIKAGTLRRESAEKGVAAAKGSLYPQLVLSGGLNTNYSSAAQRSIFVDSGAVATSQFIQTPGGGRQTVYEMRANYLDQKISYSDQFRNNYGTTVGLGISIPILNYFQNRNRVKLAKINLQTQRYTEQTNQVQLKVNVDQAYANMLSGYERFQVLQKQATAYAESFRIAETKFNAGAINSVEFLIVKGNLDRANVNLINARYDYMVRTKILDYYQGKLNL